MQLVALSLSMARSNKLKKLICKAKKHFSSHDPSFVFIVIFSKCIFTTCEVNGGMFYMIYAILLLPINGLHETYLRPVMHLFVVYLYKYYWESPLSKLMIKMDCPCSDTSWQYKLMNTSVWWNNCWVKMQYTWEKQNLHTNKQPKTMEGMAQAKWEKESIY